MVANRPELRYSLPTGDSKLDTWKHHKFEFIQ
jgi:hypothetical protein